ncbi:hypothetical protein MMCCUG48898_2913 [Mycobacteroides abscessus subsp. massiliense CCUG 48898 = JCM 15300]|nr:hypothetical protein MMCCUG48898_2913 [Mycobacteroides abscessus subsp. massiliense CCUG 48898 = JCM 15300]BAP97687.1 hypothetical protein MMASJCM_2911 [Mycobacteroides abscessus subsp. massiliense CCUG 48898 = JCM 15300]
MLRGSANLDGAVRIDRMIRRGIPSSMLRREQLRIVRMRACRVLVWF